jgi:hypothetical protein
MPKYANVRGTCISPKHAIGVHESYRKKHILTSKGSPILIMKKRETKLNLKHFFFVKLFPTKFMDGSYRLVVAKDKA